MPLKAPDANSLHDVLIRPMQQADVPEATRIFRLAFGTFLGLPDPTRFAGDSDFVTSRWPYGAAALVAEADGQLAGSNLLTRWGSFAFFGPLTVRPDLWGRQIAQKLLAPTMDFFDRWDIAAAGLFTFPHSPKHIALYQKYGFSPRFLTPVMALPSLVSTRRRLNFRLHPKTKNRKSWPRAVKLRMQSTTASMSLRKSALFRSSRWATQS